MGKKWKSYTNYQNAENESLLNNMKYANLINNHKPI